MCGAFEPYYQFKKLESTPVLSFLQGAEILESGFLNFDCKAQPKCSTKSQEVS